MKYLSIIMVVITLKTFDNRKICATKLVKLILKIIFNFFQLEIKNGRTYFHSGMN